MVITFNHERYIDECLRAVAAQTFRDMEVVVIDDASSDDTVERIRPWLDRFPFPTQLLVNERNLGICATRNRAIAATSGTYLSSVSGDDFYAPDKIERQHRAFSSYGDEVGAVFSNMRIVTTDGTPVRNWYLDGRPPTEGRIFDELIEDNFLPSPAVMSRRDIVEAVGGYDESLFYEDYDMWLRVADRHEFRFVPGEVVNYRWSRKSMSRNTRYTARMYASSARLLMKWEHRDPRTAAIVHRRAWPLACRAFAYDPTLGREALRVAAGTHPSTAQRATIAAAAIPGADRAAKGAFDVYDAVDRRRRRLRHRPRSG
jgi:glycosyltransferase involved in cell wall biosynthesis